MIYNQSNIIKKKVLIAMSGGVDSSMAAYLLKEQGFDLIGVTLRVFNSDKYRVDSLTQNIKDASVLANKLEIPYYIIDISKEFETIVIKNFVSEYHSGRTPNPCALCNREIKWKNLINIADNLGCELIATGHYSIINRLNDRYYITRADDDSKDQSSFLWRLNQNELKRTVFPLGQLKKIEIKKLAATKGYVNLAAKQESYNICFIPDGDYRKYLEKNSGTEFPFNSGNFIDELGNIIGTHSGIANYTIGQRSGVNVNEPGKWYVLKIIADKNQIVLGNQNSLLKYEFFVKEYNFSKYDFLPFNIKIHIKVNYRSKLILCNMVFGNEQIKIQLSEPALAISSGQSIAFYEGNDLIGGGVIC